MQNEEAKGFDVIDLDLGLEDIAFDFKVVDSMVRSYNSGGADGIEPQFLEATMPGIAKALEGVKAAEKAGLEDERLSVCLLNSHGAGRGIFGGLLGIVMVQKCQRWPVEKLGGYCRLQQQRIVSKVI